YLCSFLGARWESPICWGNDWPPQQHKRDLYTRVGDWFGNEWKHGYPVKSVLLHSCEVKDRRQLETEWMNEFPNLINERKWSPGNIRHFWIIRGREFRIKLPPPEIPE